jgi:hypothetical protein
MDPSTLQELIQLLRNLEGELVRVTFHNGSVYDLKILATMHAQEGGDVIADVCRTLQSAGEPPDLWQRGAMNFRLENVRLVHRHGARIFPKS